MRSSTDRNSEPDKPVECELSEDKTMGQPDSDRLPLSPGSATGSSKGGDDQPVRQETALSWMLRGILVGALVMGAANALSFFVRSKGWGGLLGHDDPHDEAIGFPWTVWQESGGYGTHGLRVFPFVACIMTALLLGCVIGMFAVRARCLLNRMMTRMEMQSGEHVRMQFSLSGLLVTTVLCALTAAAIKSFSPHVEMLVAIYVLGPTVLIAVAFLPRKLSWQQRVSILTPMALATIVAAITLGISLEIEFDKVLMGIFICWTPQAAIGAVLLSSWILLREYQAMAREGVLTTQACNGAVPRSVGRHST